MLPCSLHQRKTLGAARFERLPQGKSRAQGAEEPSVESPPAGFSWRGRLGNAGGCSLTARLLVWRPSSENLDVVRPASTHSQRIASGMESVLDASGQSAQLLVVAANSATGFRSPRNEGAESAESAHRPMPAFFCCPRLGTMRAFARPMAGGARRLQSLPVPSFRFLNLAPSVTSFESAVSDFHGTKEPTMPKSSQPARAAASFGSNPLNSSSASTRSAATSISATGRSPSSI